MDRVLRGRKALGCIDIEGWLATEEIFAQFTERGVADIGHILATSDKEMSGKVPRPAGLGTKIPSQGTQIDDL